MLLRAENKHPHTHTFFLSVRDSLACARALSDAKLAFTGDEGAGIQMAVEGGVYAEEERSPASDDDEDETFSHRKHAGGGSGGGRAPPNILQVGGGLTLHNVYMWYMP